MEGKGRFRWSVGALALALAACPGDDGEEATPICTSCSFRVLQPDVAWEVTINISSAYQGGYTGEKVVLESKPDTTPSYGPCTYVAIPDLTYQTSSPPSAEQFTMELEETSNWDDPSCASGHPDPEDATLELIYTTPDGEMVDDITFSP